MDIPQSSLRPRRKKGVHPVTGRFDRVWGFLLTGEMGALRTFLPSWPEPTATGFFSDLRGEQITSDK
jgi:hypothetical protein